MNTLEEQALQFKLTTEEYIRKKDELDKWYLEQLYYSVRDKPLTLKEKIIMLCAEFKIDHGELISSSRARGILAYRQLFIYALRYYAGYTTIEIARELKKDHSTMIHSCQKVQGWISVRRSYEEELSILERAKILLEKYK